MKTILCLALQEQVERSKVVENKINSFTKKVVIFVEAVHHYRFITRESSQYTVLKKKSTAKVHSPINCSPSIKKEMAGASSSHLSALAPQEGSTQECPISLDDD